MKTPKSPEPEDFARALRNRFNLPPVVDLARLASQIGLEIREVESEGFEGALVRASNRPIGIVALKGNIREAGRKRFTLAHEYGHFVLPGHGSTDCICKSENIETYRRGTPEQEIDANRFSSELLLPTEHVGPIVRKQWASISTAKYLASEFQTSLTAAALKCVTLSDKPDVFVMSVNGRICWYRQGPEFGYHIAVGEELSPESIASGLSPQKREGSGNVPAEAWIRAIKVRETAKIWEDSILLPYYNSILTIVSKIEEF